MLKCSVLNFSALSELKKNIPTVENVVKKATGDLKKMTEAETKASEQVTITVIALILCYWISPAFFFHI